MHGVEHVGLPGTTAVKQSSRYENTLVAVLALAGGVSALEAQAVFFLMPFIAVDLKLDNTQIGLIGSAVLISWSVAGVVIAQVSDRSRRRKPYLVGAFVVFALFSVMSAYARSFVTMFFARLAMGFAEGPVIPMQQSIMHQESSPHRRGLNMGIVQNFGAQFLGSLVAPILMIWIAQEIGWRNAFLVAGGPGLVVAFLLHWLVREPAWPSEAGAMVQRQKRAFLTDVLMLLRVRNVLISILIGSSAVAWYFGMLTFLPLVAVGELGLSPGSMSVIVSMIGAAGAISAIVVPGLSDRIGRRKAIILFAFLGIVAPGGVFVFGADTVSLGAAVFIGSFMLGTFPLFMGAIPIEAVPASHAASASALVICISQILGGVCGPALGGILADRFGQAVPLEACMALAALAGVFAFFLREPATPVGELAPK